MNYGSKILDDIANLIRLFEPHCEDRSTLHEIERMLGNQESWSKGHDLFSKIRQKTLKTRNPRIECQYLFEEICAKTLYNLSRSSAPFDPDSPYWIIPNAISFARKIEIADVECLNAVMPKK